MSKQKHSKPLNQTEMILRLADQIAPKLQNWLADVRNPQGMKLQPAHVRGIALVVAQNALKARATRMQQFV